MLATKRVSLLRITWKLSLTDRRHLTSNTYMMKSGSLSKLGTGPWKEYQKLLLDFLKLIWPTPLQRFKLKLQLPERLSRLDSSNRLLMLMLE